MLCEHRSTLWHQDALFVGNSVRESAPGKNGVYRLYAIFVASKSSVQRLILIMSSMNAYLQLVSDERY